MIDDYSLTKQALNKVFICSFKFKIEGTRSLIKNEESTGLAGKSSTADSPCRRRGGGATSRETPAQCFDARQRSPGNTRCNQSGCIF
mmetsp:Transcript_2281/g.4903  ORF Transcript_2281/g.4903 Transcript_2281/m.4903 type:complete len:87 (+) Transcript_2281:47-307(+)